MARDKDLLLELPLQNNYILKSNLIRQQILHS